MATERSSLLPVTPDGAAAAFAFAVVFVRWWLQAGTVYYGKKVQAHYGITETASGRWMRVWMEPAPTAGHDAGLEGMANDAARVIGGWRSVRRLMATTPPKPPTIKPSRGIRLRGTETPHDDDDTGAEGRTPALIGQ